MLIEGLFGYTHYCVSNSCASEIRPFNHNWGVSRKGANAPTVKKCRGGGATPLPPPLIICGSGVTQAGATGAYKDLCARKGIRLQPRTNGGEAHSHSSSSPAPRQFVPAAGFGTPALPWIPDGWSLATSGLGTFSRSWEARNRSFLLASPHPGPARAAIPYGNDRIETRSLFSGCNSLNASRNCKGSTGW